MVYLPGTGISLRYIGFPFVDASNPAGYIAVGRIGFGLSFTPSINFIDEFTRNKTDLSLLTTSEGGQISSIQRPRRGAHTFPFKGLTANDIAYFDAIYTARGNGRDLWVCEDPDDAQNTTYYCRLANTFDPKHIEGTELYELTIIVEELL